MKKMLLFAGIMLAAVMGPTSCKGDKEEKTMPVAEVLVTPTSVILTEGETSPLRATVLPSDATDYTLTWSTSDPSVATISQDGVITAVKVGSATITASAGGKNGTSIVTVVAKVIPVDKIELSQTELSLEEGQTAVLRATVTPTNASNPMVTWSSSDQTIVSVDSQGKVTAVKVGSAVITATADGKTANCSVTVTAKVIPVESIRLDYSTLELDLRSTFMIKATVTPDNATDTSFSWSSTDEKVATISANGVVHPVSVGQTTVTATTSDGNHSASCQVTIYDPDTRIYYVTSDGNPISFDGSALQNVVSNEYTGDYGLIIFSERVTSIGAGAFSSCTTLTEIDLPESLEQIGAGAFNGCSSLVAFGSNYASPDQRCLMIDDIIVAFAPAGLSKYSLPTGSTAIAPYAFSQCTELTSITIPETCSSIGSLAFAECSRLATIYINRQTPPNLENANAFAGLREDYVIYVPEDFVEDYRTTEGWKEVKSHIVAYIPMPMSPPLGKKHE